MNTRFNLLHKALAGDFLSLEDALHLYLYEDTSTLMLAAHRMRMRMHPEMQVTWIIDRNVNYTNVCSSGCQFCNFYRGEHHKEAYITTIEQYKQKIDLLFTKGGNQLLLQGGMHPHLGLDFYTSLFKQLKQLYPALKLHALGPPEIAHISKIENISYADTLKALIAAGLDSLPGAGAEILSDRVRQVISKNKCNVQTWLEVMREAHKLGLTTSATMMFGHIETLEERLQHIVYIRELQEQKPNGVKGFVSFIPWPFQSEGTALKKLHNIQHKISADEYVRMIAISRLMLPNVPNIQASWLTVGKQTAQVCLYAGANDFGSIMIEENVVSVAGANHSFDEQGIQNAIRDAGFSPQLRDQQFALIR